MTIEREIRRCDDCPFVTYDDYRQKWVCKERDYDDIDADPDHGRATWCPLDSGPVLIKAAKR